MKSKRDISEFYVGIQSAIAKLGSSDTHKTALEEIRQMLTRYARHEDKISTFLSALGSTNEQNFTQTQKKEFIKLYGFIAEVLEGDCVPFIPKITAALQKKLKESNPHFHEAIATSFGMLIHNTMHTFTDLASSCNSLAMVFKALFGNLGTSSKVLQIGSAQALTKVIQHSPLECLKYMLDRITPRLLDTLSSGSFKAHGHLIDSLISLVLSVEQDYSPYVSSTVPILSQCLAVDDFMARKQTIDAFYTLGAVLPEPSKPFAREIVLLISRCRSDKAKPVRDSAAEALAVFKKIEPEEITTSRPQTAQVSDRAKSIFKGPINKNFFKAANDLNQVQQPFAQTLPFEEKEREKEKEELSFESPKQEVEPQVTLDVVVPPSNSPPPQDMNFGRLEALETLNQELHTQFGDMYNQTRNELHYMNQRLSAIEEMVSTVTQLFDAKLKQLTNNPKIAELLSQ